MCCLCHSSMAICRLWWSRQGQAGAPGPGRAWSQPLAEWQTCSEGSSSCAHQSSARSGPCCSPGSRAQPGHNHCMVAGTADANSPLPSALLVCCSVPLHAEGRCCPGTPQLHKCHPMLPQSPKQSGASRQRSPAGPCGRELTSSWPQERATCCTPALPGCGWHCLGYLCTA